jgi:hypothetical protein
MCSEIKTLQQSLRAFAKKHGGVVQRSEEWKALRMQTVGGSEIASLLGCNPYCSQLQLLGQKAGLISRDGGGPACHWGTLFEPITERLVELELGTQIIGSDIHISGREQGFPHHANSPDGYCVVRLGREDSGQLCVLRAGDDAPAVPALALLEFKAPYRRRPRGQLPAHYRPQLQSGLALSPHVSLCLFVDAVYRLCCIEDLPAAGGAADGDYAVGYHRDRIPFRAPPAVWGVVLICEPLSHANEEKGESAAGQDDKTGRDSKDGKDSKDSKKEAPSERGDEEAASGQSGEETAGFLPIDDLAAAGTATIDRALRMVVQGDWRARYGEPVWSGHAPSPQTLPQPLPDERPVGYLPWKLFELHWHGETRDPNFASAVLPLLEQFAADRARIAESEDPLSTYAAICRERRKAVPKKAGAPEQPEENPCAGMYDAEGSPLDCGSTSVPPRSPPAARRLLPSADDEQVSYADMYDGVC